MSVCQRQLGHDLFEFIQKLIELKLWAKVRSNPDLYVADNDAHIKIFYVRSLTTSPVFAFSVYDWSAVHKNQIAYEGWITQMEVRHMQMPLPIPSSSNNTTKSVLLYVQLEDQQNSTVIEVLQMNQVYSYCFPESHVKQLRKIEGQIQSQELSIEETRKGLLELQVRFESTLQTISKLQMPGNTKMDLGPCFGTLLQNSSLSSSLFASEQESIQKCLESLEKMINERKKTLHIEYLQAIPISGNDTKESHYEMDDFGEEFVGNMDDSENFEVTGFVVDSYSSLKTSDNANTYSISVVMTDRYGCVRLQNPIQIAAYTGPIQQLDTDPSLIDVKVAHNMNAKLNQWNSTLNSLPTDKQKELSWNNACRSVKTLTQMTSDTVRKKLWNKMIENYDWKALRSEMISLDDTRSGTKKDYLLLMASQPVVDLDQMIEVGQLTLKDPQISQTVAKVVFERSILQTPPSVLQPFDPDVKMVWNAVNRTIDFSGFFEGTVESIAFKWGSLHVYHGLFGSLNTYYFRIDAPVLPGSSRLYRQNWSISVPIDSFDSKNVSFLNSSYQGDITENCIAYSFASPTIVSDFQNIKEENITVDFPSKTVCKFLIHGNREVTSDGHSWNQLHPDYKLNSKIKIY